MISIKKYFIVLYSTFIYCSVATKDNSLMKSTVSYPIPKYQWLVRAQNVCLTHKEKWNDDLFDPYQYMYPLHAAEPLKFHFPSNKLAVIDYGHPVQSFLNIQFEPLNKSTAKRDFNKSIKFFKGATLLPDGKWQYPNPAHFIFPVGVFFEWGIDKPADLPVFKRMVMSRVSSWSDFLHQWEWAQVCLEASVHNCNYSNCLFENQKQDYKWPLKLPDKEAIHPFPHIVSPNRNLMFINHSEPYLYCFEDLYIVQRYGIILSSSYYANLYRKAVVDILKRRYLSRNDTLSVLKLKNLGYLDHTIQQRCAEKSLKIIIQARPKAYFIGIYRHILNLAEVKKWSRKFTSSNVESFHIDFSTSLTDQIAKYNEFDVLITMPGSHLINLVLTNRTNVGVLEVGLAIRDTFWYENAVRFGIKHYYYSQFNHTPDKTCFTDTFYEGRF